MSIRDTKVKYLVEERGGKLRQYYLDDIDGLLAIFDMPNGDVAKVTEWGRVTWNDWKES